MTSHEKLDETDNKVSKGVVFVFFFPFPQVKPMP